MKQLLWSTGLASEECEPVNSYGYGFPVELVPEPKGYL